MDKTPIDLGGLWRYIWDTQVLDDNRAKAIGHVREDGTAAPHGTYSPVQYFRVHMGDGANGLPNAVLDIFNDKGDLGRFVWNGVDAWEATAEEVTFKVAPDEKISLEKPAELKLLPNLVLDKYDAANCPTSAKAGARYIRCIPDPAAHAADIKAQRIVPDAIEQTFSWKSNKDDMSLKFNRCYQQPRVQGEGAKSFGDTFLGDTKMAQVAFPFYGFNPSNMDLYASNPQELTPTGPGTPRASVIETNPNQTFNGTLVFAFPADDSKDYVRVEDLKDQPFLPLGLDGIPLDHKEELAHTEIVSSLQERMQSWSVTLGLSAGLDKVMDIGGTGTVQQKVEEQTNTECRYAVSRKVAKKWAILANLPSHRLHDYCVKSIISNSIALLSGRSSESIWEDFVTRYGTHYAHAITQGSIEYAETRFSLKAETKAYTTKLNLKTTSSAMLDGVKLGGTSDFSAEWANKHGIEISKEDVASYSVGTDFAMGIFFDLRPLDELFSPVFFPYNPADSEEYGKLAPFVWHQARKSFVDFLKKRAADKPAEVDFSRNYTPRKFMVTFPSISFAAKTGSDAGWHGRITLAGHDDNGLEMHNLEIPESGKKAFGTYSPDTREFFCTLTAKAGSKAPLRFLMSAQIAVDRVTLPARGIGMPIRTAVNVIKKTNQLIELTRLPSAQGGKETATAKVRLDDNGYSIEISVNAQDVGLLQ